MKNFLIRTVVGAGICAAVVAAILLSGRGAPWWFVLCVLICTVCVWELVEMKIKRWWLIALFIYFSLVGPPIFVIMHDWGAWAMLWYIFIIWANDVGAYLVGSTLGKLWRSKLAHRISPNKTWAGAFGGLAAGVGVALLAASKSDGFGQATWVVALGNTWFWVGLTVVAVVTGVIGDLLESLLKRRAGVKDSGHLLPGHGGMLDRFDSLVFSAPFVWLYFLIFA